MFDSTRKPVYAKFARTCQEISKAVRAGQDPSDDSREVLGAALAQGARQWEAYYRLLATHGYGEATKWLESVAPDDLRFMVFADSWPHDYE
jgi:hypothetical protein